MRNTTFLINNLREKFLSQKTNDFDLSLPQNILDIEDKKRSSIFTWRGQFSPQLIENLLMSYCPKNAVVLDPFAGSGTVLYESGCFGLKAFGYDLNPAAWILIRTYEFINIEPKERQSILDSVQNKLDKYFPNLGFFDISSEIDILEFDQAISNIQGISGYHEKIIIDTLVILLDLANNSLTIERIHNIFTSLCQIIRDLPYSESRIITSLCDARSLPIETNSIDFVVTSPPYINVFNYHQNYRRSAEMLGWDLLKIAKSEIGSNRANRGNRFLTVTQYCIDMAFALKEIQRACKPNSRVIFIVGYESHVLGVPFYNSSIVLEILMQSNVFDLVLNQKRNFKNKFGKVIREDLFHLVNRDFDLPASTWDKLARDIAYKVLNNALSAVADKNRYALLEAIKKVYDLDKSPIYRNQSDSFSQFFSTLSCGESLTHTETPDPASR
jgi:DNA modification methylase